MYRTSTRIQRPRPIPFAIGVTRALFTSITATVTASSTRATGEQQQQQQPSTAATTPGAAERSPAVTSGAESQERIALVARKTCICCRKKQSLQDECGRYEEQLVGGNNKPTNKWQHGRAMALSQQVQEMQQHRRGGGMNESLQERAGGSLGGA
jgi:hypothetical protein